MACKLVGMRPVVYAADIGSIAEKKFGWARVDTAAGAVQSERSGGTEISDLVDAAARDLRAGRAVALGFECPLFVPVPDAPLRLGKRRDGERDRSWSAAPGAGVMATGLVQTAWILEQLRAQTTDLTAYVDWAAFATAGGGLFLWEAFVTGAAKAATHAGDAMVAAQAFVDALPEPLAANAVHAERPLSLVGAALVWSGWSNDVDLLHTPCLVIKPAAPQP